MAGCLFIKCTTTTFPKRTMLYEVEPLLVHSQYGQADRPTQSLQIHFHKMNSCFSVNLYKNTQKIDLPFGTFFLAFCIGGNCSTPHAVCGIAVVTEQLHTAITTD
jgi:hypothetical protein